MTDRLIKDKIASLDHVKPPTNWNPGSTWNRINKSTYFSRRIMAMAALLLLLCSFGVAWMLLGGGRGEQAPLAETHQTEIAQENKQESINDKESAGHMETENNSPVLMATEINAEDAGSPARNTESGFGLAPPLEETIPLTDDNTPDNLAGQVIEAHEDTAITSETAIAGIPFDSTESSQDTLGPNQKAVSKPKLKISIALHGAAKEADKPNSKPRSSIIKLKSDYHFSTDKKFYTLQINK